MKATANRVIHIEQAELKTAAVEIRHLTINARKLTLSVFRQIQNDTLIRAQKDGGFALAGVPWGLINYYWGDMSSKYLHVLWQEGKELRRALVIKEPLLDEEREIARNIKYWSPWGYYDAEKSSKAHQPYPKNYVTPFEFKVHGLECLVHCINPGYDRFIASCTVPAIDTTCGGFEPEPDKVSSLSIEEDNHPLALRYKSQFKDGHVLRAWAELPHVKEARAAYDEREAERAAVRNRNIEKKDDAMSLAVERQRERIEDAVSELVEKENARREQYNKMVDDLAALPQLFIAV